jgi:uncharacterized repeat protein (TIGR01451 family)
MKASRPARPLVVLLVGMAALLVQGGVALAAPSADLKLTKTGPGTVTAGTNISYPITVTNNGPDTATAPSMTDTTPPSTTFVSITASGWTCATPGVGGTGTVSCTRNSDMASGDSDTITLTVQVVPSPTNCTITNTASVSSSTNDPDTSNNSDSNTAVVTGCATPARIENFNPNWDSTLTHAEGGVFDEPSIIVLSDKWDGVDQFAHLTVVATQDSVQALWYVCPPETYGAAGTSAAAAFPPPASCAQIGTDTQGTVPAAPGADVDTAYELLWDVPATMDSVARDIASFACDSVIGAGHCTGQAETGVILDDAATPSSSFGASSSGEVGTWCVDDGPLPDGTCDTATTPIGHGTVVPGFVSGGPIPGGSALRVTATFSPDVNNAALCIDFHADAFDPPNACDPPNGENFIATTQATPDHQNATFLVPMDSYPATAEMGWYLFEDDDLFGGEADDNDGFCDTGAPVPVGAGGVPDPGTGRTCLVDSHYVVASPPSAAPSITLSPHTGPPMTKVTVTGNGFGATETVEVEFDAAPVASATTSSAGSFSTPFHVPRTALPGVHTVQATGQTSGLSAIAPFLVRTDWPKFHFNRTSTGFNPFENVIRPSNVSGLTVAWTGATGNQIPMSSPAVANGVVYIGSWDDKLYAFSASGTTGCSGTPKTCQPLWTGATGAVVNPSPAVANGVVYVGSNYPDDKIYAFSASGTTGCSGTPKACQPLWTGATGDAINSSPLVANGVVYVGSYDFKLYAFSASGTTGCSGTPTTCQPLWTASTGSNINASPAVADGIVYVGSLDGKLYAFSASGTTGCSGTPKTCQPLWTASTDSSLYASPAVANGVVYEASYNGTVYAFDAKGVVNCSGTPKTCQPLWTGTIGGGSFSSPAVAYGEVYVGSSDDKLYAFSASGTVGCSGTPKTCQPLWTGATGNRVLSSPAVANGLVYVGSTDDNIYAFSALGTIGCSGTTKTCQPLWVGSTGSVVGSSPAVADGFVYVGSDDHKLYAFHN